MEVTQKLILCSSQRKVLNYSKKRTMKWSLSIPQVVICKRVNCSKKWSKFSKQSTQMSVSSLWTVQLVKHVLTRLQLLEMQSTLVQLLLLSLMVMQKVVVLLVLSLLLKVQSFSLVLVSTLKISKPSMRRALLKDSLGWEISKEWLVLSPKLSTLMLRKVFLQAIFRWEISNLNSRAF